MRHYKLFVFVLIAFLSASVASFAQYGTKSAGGLHIKKIRVDTLAHGHSGFEGFEPQGLAGLSQTALRGKWGKVEVEYSSSIDWLDEVQLTFYVLAQGGTVFKERMTQVNVAGGPSHYAAFYLHPTTLQRFGEIQKVAVEISVAGENQDTDQWPQTSRKEWWNQYPVKEGLLKKVTETPFALSEADPHEDMK
ncbi:MAG: hypothetical protein HYS08_08090 [Chlamydiae bacterium]|nr:hypothetical protein [Chlamydiota bacterium]MBI3266048.1 hypothetical protein [Chlamydiota bacterium]